MTIESLTPLRMAASGPSDTRVSTEIYRPFFLAGILSVLTAGCTLGAIALLGIAAKASYTASAWTPYVLAHANSQLYGWVGFFIIGFALQQHAPRLSKVDLFHRLAAWSLGLMAAGIAVRFVAEPMAHVDRSVWVPVGVASCVLQAIAVGLFIANTGLTRYKTGEGLTWPTTFVFASLGWWAMVALAEPFYFALAHQSDPVNSIMFVAEYFPPYRDAQFLGFVTMMIFGVSFVKMHSCFGAEEACPYFGTAGFLLWTGGLASRMIGWILYFRSGMENGSLYFLGGILLAAGAVCLVISSRMFRRLEFALPSHKFIRSAYVWLLVSGLLLILEPVHLNLTGQPFSHAYIGAIRHAATVGFISQMILGVGLHVVHMMNDIPVERIPRLWTAFVLVNLGNAMRVGFQIATDYTPRAFALMGPSGFVELIGLSIWAVAVVRPMLRSMRTSRMFRAGATA